tara:strand:+ start:3919 stop:4257 length:339 start_codon:yes stop_codon:yes gene_type:complete
MKAPKPAKLTPKELNRVLLPFKGKQQPRVIAGIHDNPGVLTHTACGDFYANNIPDIAAKSNAKLLKYGLKLLCTKPTKRNPLTNSHHWYLCDISQLEYFDTGIVAANDEVLK